MMLGPTANRRIAKLWCKVHKSDKELSTSFVDSQGSSAGQREIVTVLG
jgi:hypothetical protein